MNYGIGNPKGEKGKDGVSPIVSVEAITGGYEITITDANGTQTFTIMNGQDGTNGTNGTTPNISVNANVNNSVGTPSVSVVKTGTDAAPTLTFNFQNLKGEPGTTTIKTQIVNSLPSTGATDTIYFVPNNSGESENLYNEYLYINNAWERVDSKIDLSNYIQKSNTSGLVKNDGTIDTTQYQPILGFYDFIVNNKKIIRTKKLFIDRNISLTYSYQSSGGNHAGWLEMNADSTIVAPTDNNSYPTIASNKDLATISNLLSWTTFLSGDNSNKCFIAMAQTGNITIVLPRSEVEANTINTLEKALNWLDNNPIYINTMLNTSNIVIEDL